jgi:uncharacterized protein (TIGR02646 family)
VIRIRRSPDVPTTLASTKVDSARREIESIVASGNLCSTDFQSHWNAPDVRKALYEMQHHKCCYCERTRDEKRESDIDHFRPKALYWWLAYVWNNLFFTCRACNQEHKKDKFPLRDEATRVTDPRIDPSRESYLLLHPCEDDPEEFLRWEWGACLEPRSPQLVLLDHREERGRVTVVTLGLNDGELPIERGRIAVRFEALITKYRAGEYLGNETLKATAVHEILREIAPSQEFLGLRRAMLRNAGLGWIIETGSDSTAS